MKIPRLLISSLVLAATLLGCGALLAQEKTPAAPTVSTTTLCLKASEGDAKALAELRGRAEKGEVSAQNWLGGMYDTGQGVAKDEVEAVKWYRKAADQGYAPAQSNLGVMYRYGTGVAKDEVEAYKWYLLAGAGGNEIAKGNIGLIEKILTPAQRAEGQKRATEFNK